MSRPRKLVSVGHSYVVTLNRRLMNEIARIGQGQWEVTAVAPSFVHGDLRPLHLEPDASELCHVEGVPVYLSKRVHVMTYGWRLREILQSGWDLVHSWEEPFILPGAQIAWWTPSQTPIVYFSFQNNSKNYLPPFNWMEQYAMSRAVGWISPAQTVTDALKTRRGYSCRTELIPLGVDVDAFYPSRQMGADTLRTLGWDQDGPPVIGFLGRLVPDKGLPMLMRVMDRLQAPWRALFVGTGPMESEIRNWGERHPGRVQVCTDAKHHQVPKYLNAMDMLAAPSQTMPNWREQFGRMLIEGFACGLPVLGSDSGEIPFVIGDAGLVLGEKDENGWLKAISGLLEEADLRNEWSQKGLQRARTTYAWPIVAQKHLDFFTQLLDSRRHLSN